MIERRNSAESMNSMIGRELAEIEGDGDSHVLKPSELTKGRKRKNIPTREEISSNDSMEGDDEFTQLQPKPGAHMVLPFIPPKVAFQDSLHIGDICLILIMLQFPTMKKEGDSLIKPSEYLKSLTSRGASLPRFVFSALLCQHTNICISLLCQHKMYFHWFVNIQKKSLGAEQAMLPRLTCCQMVITSQG